MIKPFGRFGGVQDTRMLLDVTVSAFTLSGGPGTETRKRYLKLDIWVYFTAIAHGDAAVDIYQGRNQ